ncbi:MAG: oxidoreductase [Microbacterium sp.]|uniref:NAD(P)-dependent oxidoreductase n=1 Tax=uncultured Microbacterium sp. TaxID=191216 RepID=UPI000C983832|nr:NAD(P)-dependent oxidoreductase [uncultured Microbacterium sp.]MAL06202.1 oxidoreductase [Microbacterium sp.]
MTDIGFLGLGTMGRAMAGRLLETGHRVTVWNRSDAPVAELVAAGAVAAASPADALGAPVSISMLADDAAADAVLTEDALGAARGHVHVNAASLSPDTADLLAARAAAAGAGYVSAPVLGRYPVAAAGQLNILAAGDPAAIETARPALASLAARIWEFGAVPRTANIVKIAVNYDLIHAMQAIGESVALVERHGVEASAFVDLLTHSLFAAPAYSIYGDVIAQRRYSPPGFHMSLGFKDLRLAEAAAASVGLEMPTAAALHGVFERAIADPSLRDLDWSAIAEVTRSA